MSSLERTLAMIDEWQKAWPTLKFDGKTPESSLHTRRSNESPGHDLAQRILSMIQSELAMTRRQYRAEIDRLKARCVELTKHIHDDAYVDRTDGPEDY